MVFRDGLPAWSKAGYPVNVTSAGKNVEVPMIKPARLHAALDDVLVVDIRPASSYELGYLPDSRAMPMAYLSMLSVELPRDRKIVVVDHNGKQGKTAAKWLKNNGFADVRWLEDGLIGYAKAGFDLEK